MRNRHHPTNPAHPCELARLLGVPLVELTGECGHLGTSCEEAKVKAEIGKFLATK